MIRIFVNNISFFIKKDISVLEALSFLGLKIPRFCYHEALSIAGNCRICLVEINTSLKLVASCAQPILPNIQIFSNTVKVLKSRENVLESLLLNHPLDCPICDQAGECDLQDQSKVFGSVSTRYVYPKRGVENKIIDPGIKTIMTRCIHCTRCVRFASEIMGKAFLGTLNRGKSTEIGGFISYLHDQSEVSGNVIDLCPVGALTAKPYAYKARPWELRTTETLDLTDGLGSNVYVNTKELQIISVLPKANPYINGQWISNKARFYVDAYQRYRLTKSYKNINTDSGVSSSVVAMANVFSAIVENKAAAKSFIVTEDLDFGSFYALKRLNAAKKAIGIYNTSSFFKQSNFYTAHSSTIASLENASSKCIVLLASNIRTECAVLNVKLRIKTKNKRTLSLSFGPTLGSTFNVKFINITTSSLIAFLEGKNGLFSKPIFSKSQPIFIVGEAIFKRIAISKHEFNSHILTYNASSVLLIINTRSNSESIASLNIKSLNSRVISKSNAFLNLCLLDDTLFTRTLIARSKTVTKIWLNTHGSNAALACEYIVPVASFFETESIFLNLEKRPQKTNKVIESATSSIFPIATFINELSVALGLTIKNLSQINNHLIDILVNPILFDKKVDQFKLLTCFSNKNSSLVSNYPFKLSIADFYLNNSCTKYSLHMTNYSNKRQLNSNIFKELN